MLIMNKNFVRSMDTGGSFGFGLANLWITFPTTQGCWWDWFLVHYLFGVRAHDDRYDML